MGYHSRSDTADGPLAITVKVDNAVFKAVDVVGRALGAPCYRGTGASALIRS
ncbi:MAG: hypothetical protein M3Y56_05090 [Armatimonadota bacterium]|nr:hypothetical protein [Armatimonadota bacterium]